MKFKGDIIITDPCYIDTEDSKLWDGDKVDIYRIWTRTVWIY